jgi:hypothetical protein
MNLIRHPNSCGVVTFTESRLVKGWFRQYWKDINQIDIPVETYGTKAEPLICKLFMYATMGDHKVNVSKARYGHPLSFEHEGRKFSVSDGGLVYRACGFMSMSEARVSFIHQFC